MADAFHIYISSTIEDLREEREVVARVASRFGVIKDSYRASDEGVVESCVKDVQGAGLYIGILGHRYGWIPDGPANPEGKSITEIEYDAAGRKGIPRLIFLRMNSEDRYRDAETKQTDPDRIRHFRDRPAERRTDEFRDLKGLEIALLNALPDARDEFYRAQVVQTPAFDPASRWRTLLRPVVIYHVPGTDAGVVKALTGRSDGPFVAQAISPQQTANPLEPTVASAVEEGLRQAQAGCLLITAQSLQRMTEPEGRARFDFVLKTLNRRGCFAGLVLAGEQPSALPDSWRNLACSTIDKDAFGKASDAAVAQLFDEVRDAVSPAATRLPRVALPVLVIAPTAGEMAALTNPSARTFAAFDVLADVRLGQFKELRKVAAKTSKPWPTGFYGPTREDWRCFAPNGRTVTQLVAAAVSAINNAAPGSRERSEMQLARIVVRRYSLDEYLDDTCGSRAALEELARTALICVDETALFHSHLHEAAQTLLAQPQAAIVSISPCDPTHAAMRVLLSEGSFLLGALRTRFQADFDPQCELSLNSEARLMRWLRTAIPRLLRDAAGHSSVPRFADRVDEVLADSGT